MNFVRILIFITLLTGFSLAQPNVPQGFNGTVTGKIVDSESSAPVEYANVVIYNSRDSSMSSGGVSNSKGLVQIEKLKPGNYYAKISFIGYEPVYVDKISINLKVPAFDIGTIKILNSSVKLSEVTVSGERDMLSYNLDKKIIDVEKNLTSAGGTVSDVLQNVPSVNVDADGSVSVRGNPNVTILIDGKPSGLSGISSTDVLTQIPASSVQRIELVTNPSAKYDPEGTAGIINIVLKRKSNAGVNGFITLNAGNNDKYNSSLNLNFKTGLFNLYANYDGRFNNFNSTLSSVRNSFLPAGTSILEQDQSMFMKNRMHNATAGLDFFADDFNTLSFNYQFRDMEMDYSGLMNNTNTSSWTSGRKLFVRDNDAGRGVTGHTFTLSHKMLFETPGQEWLTDVSYSANRMSRDEIIYQRNLNPSDNTVLSSFSQLDVSKNKNNMFILQTDYSHPLSDKIKLETGFKFNLKDLSMDNNYYLYDENTGGYTLNSHPNFFTIDEKIYSVYLTYLQQFGDLSVQLGVRGEDVENTSKLVSSGESFDNGYFSVYPSLHAAYKMFESDEVSFSYSKRVDRPNNRQLNPFVDNADSLNIFYGNPKLKPQYTNSFELGYSKLINRTSLSLTAFYRNTTDIISIVSSIDALGVNNTTYANIASSHFTGAEFLWTQPLGMWLRINANVSYFNTRIDDPRFTSMGDFNSWSAKLTSNMTLWEDLQLQLFANYNSPSIMAQQSYMHGGSVLSAQTETKEIWFMDAALKKDFYDGRVSVMLRVSDIFNTRKFESETNALDFNMLSYRKMDTRVVYLGVTLRLSPGNMKNEEQRKPRTEEGIDL